jgi:hypothetical protein
MGERSVVGRCTSNGALIIIQHPQHLVISEQLPAAARAEVARPR